MDWNDILLLLVSLSCLQTLWQAFGRHGQVLWGWLLAGAVVLLVTALACWLRYPSAGMIGLVAWLGLIVAPMMLMRQARRNIAAGSFNAARRWYDAAVLLHPADGWIMERRLVEAQRHAAAGREKQSQAILQNIAARPSRHAHVAQAMLLRQHQQWDVLADWMNVGVHPADMQEHPDLVPTYLRSLGETGDLPGLLAAYFELLPDLEAGDSGLRRWLCILMALAFSGREASLLGVLDGPLAQIPPRHRAFWLATAATARGQRELARQLLQPLLASGVSVQEQRAAQRRLDFPLFDPAQLDPARRLDLARIETECRRLLGDGGYTGRMLRRPWATYGLVLANGIVFAVEILMGGATEEQVLNRLGAMQRPGELHHQWWRLITANFLHYGWLHLLMNMLALLVLGPFVELTLRLWRFLLIYLLAGIVAVGGVYTLQALNQIRPDSLVGASGAIMGLVGASGGILLRGWLRDRRGHTRRRLMSVVWIVALQATFDALPMSKNVSSSAHLIGCFAGFFLALLLWREPPEIEEEA